MSTNMQQARQLQRGVRILSTGDLQLSISEQDRVWLMETLYGANPDVFSDLMDSIPTINYSLLAEALDIANQHDKNNWYKGNRSIISSEFDWLEYLLCNGWDTVSPDEIGALVDDTTIILTPDNGDTMYYWEHDWDRSFLADLISKGEAIFTSVPSL